MKIFQRSILLFFLGIILKIVSLDGKLTFSDKSSTISIKSGAAFRLYSTDRMDKITGTIQTAAPTNIAYGSGIGKLFFENGVLVGTLGDDIFEINFTGTYDTNSSYSLILDGAGDTFNMITPGGISERLRSRGTGGTIMGYPVFSTPTAILLGTNLIMAADGEVNTNVNINGGTLTLGADLRLQDDVKITNSGVISFQGNNVFTGQKDLLWTDTQLFIGAKNLDLGAKSTVRGQWHFKNDAHIVGNNFMLDLTNGGSIFIKPNTTLRISNLTLKGLGTGFIIFERPTSKLELFNVIIDMDKNVTMTLGNVYISGDSTVVTRDKFLTFDATTSLSVDRSTFFYDTLNYNDQNNVQFTNLSSNYASLNGGSIKKVRALPVGDFIVSADIILDRSFIISPLKKLLVQNNATINGDGFAYQFALDPGETIFYVSAGKRAQFQNILIQDFPPDYVSLGSGSQLIFGPSATVSLGTSSNLTTTWYFTGRTVLNGNNNILNLTTDGHIVLRPGASLWINNITLRGIKGHDSWSSIICMDNRCTVSFGNVTWVQDADYSFTQGRFGVVGYWDMQGTATFNYATNKQSTITSFGTLEIDKDFTFHYMPSSDNRDLIAMDSNQAVLNLNGGTLSSTTTGIRLTKGTLMIPELCSLYNYGAVAQSEGISFGNNNPADDLTIRIEGNLQLLAGRLMYENAE